MTADVKRRYDASRRRAHSATTRQAIIEAAGVLMLTGGYRSTTIAAIAEQAAVNADTVYELVGRKPVILRELLEQSISGKDHEVPAEERDYVRAVRAEPDPAAKLAIYAEAVSLIMQRLAGLYQVVREAAPSQPEVAALWREISSRRAANMKLLVSDLAQAGPLRDGLDIDRAADTVWALNSPDVFLLLTHERGWRVEQYRDWLADTWVRLLLP